MPVVLSTAEGQPRSGYTYDDRTGVSYEYPGGRYERLIVAGEPFLYHQPGQGYTGMGIIGDIQASSRPKHLVCEILDCHMFDAPASLKNSKGYYYEADQAPGNIYWAQGVRPISTAAYEAVVASAGVTAAATGKGVKPNGGGGKGGYASPEVIAAVDEYAMLTAMVWTEETFEGAPIERMAHNNPGYDIRVGPPTNPEVFVEVKGTQTGEPAFFISEGERKFSLAHAERYVLIVISGIDSMNQTHGAVTVRQGAVDGPGFELEPRQWRGRILDQ